MHFSSLLNQSRSRDCESTEHELHDDLALTPFILDLLDFIQEKIAEALESEVARRAALSEAAGAIPLLRERLRENELANAQFILALGNAIEERWASEWWDGFEDGAKRV